MKKIILTIIILCNIMSLYGDNVLTTNAYETTSNLPFLNKDRVISINRDESERLRKVDKRYIKLMTDIINSETDKELKKANLKALSFFEDLKEESAIVCNVLANYQLGHYYAFGIFDPYFDGKTPSNIEREKLSPINKTKACEYFNDICRGFKDSKGFIQLIPNTWYFNIEEGLAAIGNSDYKKIVSVLKFLDENNYDFNPQKVCRNIEGWCDNCNISSIYSCGMFNILYAIDQLPPTSTIRKKTYLDLSSDEIASLALSYGKQFKHFEVLYLSALSAVRGNANGYLIFVEKWSDLLLKHYKAEHPEEYKAGIPYFVIPLTLFSSVESCLKLCNIPNFDKLYENVNNYYNDIAENFFEEYEANLKAKRQARKRELWRQLGMAVLGAIQNTNNQLAYYYNHPKDYKMGNLNNLLDPRVAAMQVNAQYYAEYQNFCLYNKKPDGSNYTYSEWLAIQGQAIQNLKEQGVDLVAELSEQNRQNKQEWRNSLDAERKERLNRLGVDTSNMTGASNNSSKNAKNDYSKEKESNDIQKEMYNRKTDSKEQYKREAVSSDEYHFEKHVTLYIRDGNSNKMMFSNKDLCKKGANYYVKIENMYYLVSIQGGWGFNSSILYSHKKLYFNK